jgi:hypothetical protein
MASTAFSLALASFISLHPVLLLPPVAMLCYDRYCQKVFDPETQKHAEGDIPPAGSSNVALDRRSQPPMLPFLLILTMVFGSILAMLFGLSRLFLPSWNFVPAVFMTPLTLPDLTPNPGLWWYFFIEMFDAFREFFLGVFWLHMLSYSVPFALRFSRQPLAGVLLMMGVIAIFQPYANAGDVGAWLSALCLLGHVFERKLNVPAIGPCDLPCVYFVLTLNSSHFDLSIQLPSSRGVALRDTTWARIPPSMDLRGLWKRQFLLRHHLGMEPGPADLVDGHNICCSTR